MHGMYIAFISTIFKRSAPKTSNTPTKEITSETESKINRVDTDAAVPVPGIFGLC
jgi:hypothetical protein